MNIAAILSLLTAAAPGVVSIVKDIQSLAASTGLTTDQVAAAVAALASTTQATDAKTLAVIAADQAPKA